MQEDSMGARIAEAREAAGYSAAQAARRLGIHSKTLQRWERGESEPRGNRLMMLAGMFGVTPAWLLGGEQYSQGRTENDWDQVRSQLTNARQMLASLNSIIDSLEKKVDQATGVSSGED